MPGVDRYGGDIDDGVIRNVSNYIECNRLCNERNDCFVWTYIEGSCYVKDENTFRTNSSNAIGGIKDCNSSTQQGNLDIDQAL